MTNREIYKYHLQNQTMKGNTIDFLIRDRIRFFDKISSKIVDKLLTEKDAIMKEYLRFEDGKVKLTKDSKKEPVFLMGKNKEDFEKAVNDLMDQPIKTSPINRLRLYLFPYFLIPFLSR